MESKQPSSINGGRKSSDTDTATGDSISSPVPINDLPLSKRTKHCLLRAGYKTSHDIQMASDSDLLNISGLGITTLEEIRNVLSSNIRGKYVQSDMFQALDTTPRLSDDIQTPPAAPPIGNLTKDNDKDCNLPLEVAALPLKELRLSTRLQNALINHRVWTIGQLAIIPRDELAQIRNMGSTSIAEAQRAIDTLNIPALEESARIYHKQGRSAKQVQLTATPLTPHVLAVLKRLNLKTLADLDQYMVQTPPLLHDNRLDIEQVTAVLRMYGLPATTQEQDSEMADPLPEAPNESAAPLQLRNIIHQILGLLNERTRQILIWYYGLFGNKHHTLDEIGKEISISRQRVLQLKHKGLTRLQAVDTAMLRDSAYNILSLALFQKSGVCTITDLCLLLPSSAISSENDLQDLVALLTVIDPRLKFRTSDQLVYLAEHANDVESYKVKNHGRRVTESAKTHDDINTNETNTLDLIPSESLAKSSSSETAIMMAKKTSPSSNTPATLARSEALEYVLDVLRDGLPRMGRQITEILTKRGIKGVNKTLVNSVLSREGRKAVIYDRRTYTYSIATAPDVEYEEDNYDRWNRALISFFTQGLPRGTAVFINLDDELLEDLERSQLFFDEHLGEGLIQAVQRRVIRNGRVDLRQLATSTRDNMPKGIGFLALTVLAASRMGEEEEISQTNYFVRLREVLGLSSGEGRPFGMENGAKAEEPLWKEWNDWLEQHGYLSSAHSGEGANKYIQYATSQPILRRSDKDKLYKIFSMRNWPHTLDAEQVVAHIRKEINSLSVHLRNALESPPHRYVAVVEAIGDIFAQWYTNPQPGTKRGQNRRQLTAGLYRVEDLFSATVNYYLYPRAPRRLRVEGITYQIDGSEYILSEERPGWYTPTHQLNENSLNQVQHYPVLHSNEVDELILPRRDFWVLIPDPEDPESGIYASWGVPDLGTPFIILCNKNLLPQLQRLRDERLLEWQGSPQPIFTQWIELHHCMALSQQWTGVIIENQELFNALKPRSTISISVTGGLRVPGTQTWVEGHPPTVTIIGFERYGVLNIKKNDDEIPIFEGDYIAQESIQIPWDGPGEYRIEITDGTIPIRTVRLVSWEDVRVAQVEQRQILKIGVWQVSGALISREE